MHNKAKQLRKMRDSYIAIANDYMSKMNMLLEDIIAEFDLDLEQDELTLVPGHFKNVLHLYKNKEHLGSVHIDLTVSGTAVFFQPSKRYTRRL